MGEKLSETREKLDESKETTGEAGRQQEKQGDGRRSREICGRRWRVQKGQKHGVERVGAGHHVTVSPANGSIPISSKEVLFFWEHLQGQR